MKLPRTLSKTFHFWLTPNGTDENPSVHIDTWKGEMAEHGWVYLGKDTIMFDVPQGVNVEAERLRALQEQLDKVEVQRNKILDQIKKYQALPNEAAYSNEKVPNEADWLQPSTPKDDDDLPF